MNLQEQISRIQEVMGVINEQLTGDTIVLSKQMVNKPVILIGTKKEKTEVNKVKLLDNGTVDIHLKNGQTINVSQNRLRSLNLKIPITFHMK